MARFLLLPLAVFTAGGCFSQQIAISPSTIAGIQVVGPQSPNFAATVAEIVGPEQPPAFTAWLPYGVVIQNNSSQPLAAVCVEWTAKINATVPTNSTGCEDAFNMPPRRIMPGQSVVAIPSGILQTPRDLRPYARGAGLGNLSNWQRAESIAVSVDSVVFASGQFVGSDTADEYEKFQAELTVPPSVAATLLQKKETDTIPDIINWLASLAQSRQSSEDYSVRQSGITARGMLGVYQNRGEAALYQMAETMVQQPVFPLHR